jgi:omega-6 fatty acid desaturase (delta-12 desaturase)
MTKIAASAAEPTTRTYGRLMARYARPVLWKSLWQIADTLVPLAASWYLAYLSLDISYALTLFFAVLCSGFLVRVTIFQHDCGHYAFFRSRWANEAMGHVCTLFNLTPLCFWLRQHSLHHTMINNLDRGDRDIYAECLTVKEYLALPRGKRLAYRITRDPLVFFPIIAPLTLAVATRFPITLEKSWKAERRNVYLADLGLLAWYGALGYSFGWVEVALIQLPILIIGSAVGLWLDFLGHKFQSSTWVRSEGWELSNVAMNGCGFFRLPKVLQWFSGSIGIHHIHHLNPKIPNYNLRRCHDENPIFHGAKTFNLWQGIKAAWLVLWDEDRGRLVTFAEVPRPARAIPPEPAAAQ